MITHENRSEEELVERRPRRTADSRVEGVEGSAKSKYM